MSLTIEKMIVPILVDCVEKISQSKSAKRFKSRARDLPTDLFTRGLAYTLTYIAARSSATLVEIGLTVNSCDELISNLEKSNVDEEELGYALYGALILFSIKKMGLLRKTRFADIVKEALSNHVLDHYAMIVAEWTKRLAEAYI